MENSRKNNVHLVLRQTNALSGTPRIFRRQALSLAHQGTPVTILSESIHSELQNKENIRCKKVWKWPKNSLFQRRFFDWQTRRINLASPNSLVIGHGDTLHQDILFLHTCVHKGAEVAPGPHNNKNLSIPLHRMIFEQGSFKMLVCNSKMMKDDIQKRFNVTQETHILYPAYEKEMVNSVNPTAVTDIRQKLGNKLVVGLITSGNLENRGATALIKAAGKLSPAEKQKISILIVGNEKHPEKYYQLATDVGLHSQVMWMKPRIDVANLISAVDIVVHAARIEAFGMSVLESMVLARPIITTSTTGCGELFAGIQKDFIIQKQSEDEIAPKLSELIQNASLRQSMGAANRIEAEKYTWENYDRKFLELVKFDRY